MSEHYHDHDHDHDHHDGDTYYLDQICMVGISGAFGAICLALYIQNARAADDAQSMLRLLLGPQFHLFVLGSGIALVLVATVRAVMLWRSAGRPAQNRPPPNHPFQCSRSGHRRGRDGRAKSWACDGEPIRHK